MAPPAPPPPASPPPPGAVGAIAEAVGRGEADPVEVVEAALAAAEAHTALNALVTLLPDQALARARDGVRGRLAGVPLVVKDLLDTARVRTACGSRVLAGRVPAATAPAVRALEAEGAIVVAKANLDEFAWGVVGRNVHWGDVGNPRHPDRIAGGSSAGSAAAVAAGIAPLALGTDTGGSIRLPAAACGVAGIKPAWGAVPVEGAWPLAPSFDTVGPLASSLAGAALAHAVLTRTPVPPARLAGRRVGVLCAHPRLFPEQDEPARDERALVAAERHEALGARCEEVVLPVPDLDPYLVFQAEAAGVHAALYPAHRDLYGPNLRSKLDAARTLDPAGPAAAAAALALWRRRATSEPPVDLLLSPVLGLPELPPAGVDEAAVRVPFSAYTRPFNYLGWPAIALGEVQLAGRDPAVVLAAGLAWEAAHGPPPGEWVLS